MNSYQKEIRAIQKSAGGTGELLFPLNETLVRKMKLGATIPWWMAGITVVNLFLIWGRAPLRMAYGLVFPEFLYEFGTAAGPVFQIAGLVVGLGFLAAFAGLGIFTKRCLVWAYVLALVVVLLDTICELYVLGAKLPISLIIHGVCAYLFVASILAARTYNDRKAKGQA